MIKIDNSTKMNIHCAGKKKSTGWTKIAFGSVLISIGLGTVTNILNIINSAKQAEYKLEENNLYTHTNNNELLKIELF